MELKLDPYPTGWYPFCFSKDLKVGEVISEKYFGKELVAFRGENGEVKVVDAFCPHLGAHLGKGGTVNQKFPENFRVFATFIIKFSRPLAAY